ncbi:MAG: hypothetical protein GXY59_09760 [Bacteroidales bacterium]|jgi:predicted transcriptional regulator|nr:hypothetical protein [Bacteroidales bacterium]
MEAILLRSDSKTKTKLLLQLAKQLNIKTSKLNSEELEDLGLILSIDEGLESGLVAEDEAVKFVSKIIKA